MRTLIMMGLFGLAVDAVKQNIQDQVAVTAVMYVFLATLVFIMIMIMRDTAK